jgi:diadenosine tetraphosphatase ApaH/serine/threonine PP2A family protein phosphatase
MVRLRDGRLIVNPGSVGAPAYDDDLPYFHKMEAGHPFASYAIIEKSAGHWLPSFRNVAYDFQAMADIAAHNGRQEWASGLSTGWLR